MRGFSLTLSRYIGRQFLVSTIIVLLILAGIILLFDALEIIRRAQSKSIPLAIAIEMIFMKQPSRIQEVMPYAVLLGGILCFAKLTRSSELVAVRSAGVSVWQFLSPAIVLAFILGVFVISVFNPLAATMTARSEQIESKYIRGKTSTLTLSKTGLWLRQQNEHNDGKTVIHALDLSQNDMVLHHVTMFIYGAGNHFERRIDADSAQLIDNEWHIKDALLTKPGETAEAKPILTLPTNLSIEEIQDSFASPETLSFWQLPGFIHTLKAAGFSAIRHVLHWHSIVMTPFLLSAMVLIAAAFSLRAPRRGRTGLLIAGGIVTGFMIRFTSSLVSAFGLAGNIPIILAAWTPMLISLLIGALLMLHLEDG